MMLADDGPDGTALSFAQSGEAASFQEWADAPRPSPAGAFAAMAELRQLADPEAEPGDDAEAGTCRRRDCT
ncbi:hypothetical protein [Novosphingobium soli]|uniref:Uncharacterized protein n=1 Tax=Novosphingobium soli TaxID=574956 RepID=A0ABV6CYG4_9SPHN